MRPWRPSRPLLGVAEGCAILLAACSAAKGPAPTEGWQHHETSRSGLAVDYPPRWHVTEARFTQSVDPLERLTVTSFAVDSNTEPRGCSADGLFEQIPGDGAVVMLQEVFALGRHPEHYPVRPERFRLDRTTFRADMKCFGWPRSHQLVFRDRRRSFYFLVALGPQATDATRQRVERVINSLTVAAPRLRHFDSFESASGGVSIEYPRGWYATDRRIGELPEPIERLTVTSFPLRATDPPGLLGGVLDPRGPLKHMPADGAVISVDEQLGRGYPSRPRRFRLDHRAFAPHQRLLPGRYLYSFSFGEHGRRFDLWVALGRRAGRNARMLVVRSINSLRIAPCTRPPTPRWPACPATG